VLALSSVQSTDALVPASPELVGRLGPLLESLAEFAPAGSGWGEAAAREYQSKLADALEVPSMGLAPARLVEIAREVLPRDTVASCDAGASRLLVVQKWQAYGPREFLTSNGLATMGYAIPGGMAARLAHPERPVVCFTGDGGFMMAIAELHTAVRERLPMVVVVFDDQEIGLIRVKQEIKGMEPYGIGLGGIDWEKLAQGVGADGIAVETEGALADALTAAVKSERPVVIGARIDKSGYVAQFNALREL
jgi:acetolactate synthase-1/2/3 large subunit